MKYWFFIVFSILTGCSSTHQDAAFGGSMLDTAPKTNGELRYPEWGYVSSSSIATAPDSSEAVTAPKKASQAITSLEAFLNEHNIPHEKLRGGHLMIRLKEKIQFQNGSSKMSARSQDWLLNIGHYLAGRADVDIVIDGHTDSTGGAIFNETLSEKRAREVEKQLLASNIPRQRVFSRGFGEYIPKCNNETVTGKACNRRAELTLIVAEDSNYIK